MACRYAALPGNLLLAISSAAGFIFLLEFGAWLVGLPLGAPLLPEASNCLRRSALLGMDFRPRCRGELSETAFETNALGLRGPEVRDDGSRRILALGDSCTWGWRVAEADSYPSVLQRLLNERARPARYQVINAGTPGYTSYQGLLYLRERGLALRPAIVILGYGFNDGTTDGDVEQQLATERRLSVLMVVDDFLFANSRIYGFGRRRAMRAAGARDRSRRVDPARFAQHLEDMVLLAREHGAHVLFLSFSTTREGPYAEAQASVSIRLGVPVVAYEGPQFDVVHPTADGDRELAARILDRLELNEWVE